MRVQAAHARYLVAEAQLGENLRNAVLHHPRLVAVPEAVRCQSGLDGQPRAQGWVWCRRAEAPWAPFLALCAARLVGDKAAVGAPHDGVSAVRAAASFVGVYEPWHPSPRRRLE